MPEKTANAGGRLTVGQGTAMYVGAVLGTGVIALPAFAAEVAGPASLLAWLGLVVLSAPLAATFAALGARYPDAGGVSTYARLAFGERIATVVGWCFYFAVPPGTTAAALFAGAYVEQAFGGGQRTVVLTAVILMALVAVTNWIGLKASGRLQFVLAGLLVTLVLGSVLLSIPHIDLGNLTPFAPNGWSAIGPAAALLVWSFAGWEAITHLAQEFRRPERDLPRATAIAVAIVGLLYISVAFVIIAVLGSAAADSEAPLGQLIATSLGGDVKVIAAIAAVLLTVGSMNAYYATAAKLGAALSRDGAFPSGLSRGSMAGEVPRRSLAVVVAWCFLALGAVVVTGAGTKPMVLLTTGQFVTVYVIGTAAAVKLLPRGKARWAALVALAGVLALLAVSGPYMLWPLLVTVAALSFLWWKRRRRAAVPPVKEQDDDDQPLLGATP
ncbi:amino acid permease [Saccharothrix hoggarensis]|uniref:Amino acid permease n=1 Tax=Saccharothrix hoggarensis TaxID=913853 RepID=A0ABW3QPI3_9PSEU